MSPNLSHRLDPYSPTWDNHACLLKELFRTVERKSMHRKQNFQTIAWFWDLSNRKLLDLDPPYQRRSVWNQAYRDYYVDTILLGYPSPAIFLFERISPDGHTTYAVVDGKQRLSTMFAFLGNEFPVSDQATRGALRGFYFRDLSDEITEGYKTA